MSNQNFSKMPIRHIKNPKARSLLFHFGLVLIVVVSILIGIRTKDAPLTPITIENYNDGWSAFPEEENRTVLYERIIDSELAGKAIGFRTADSFVDVSINGENIYHYGQKSWFSNSPASVLNIVDIPKDSEGKTITVVIECAYPEQFVESHDFMVADYHEMVVDSIRQDTPDDIMNGILILIGLGLILMFFIQKYKGRIDKASLYLGMITIFFVFWSAIDLFTGQLLVRSGQLRYLIYFYTLYTLPMLIFCYLEALSDKYKPKLVMHTHILIIAVFIVLHFTRVLEFSQSLIWYCILSCVELIHALTNFSNMKEEKNKRLIKAFLVWLATIFINVVTYVINPVHGSSVFIIKIGMCFYIVVSTFTTISRSIDEMMLVHNTEIIKKQAYTDNLTGLGNRYAFEEKMKGVNIENVVIVSLDINNLKYHNDTFGHLVGDELIKTAAEILSNTYSNVYRTGGDEFIAVIDKCSKEELESMKMNLRKLGKERSNERINIQIACGYSMFQQFDKTYEDILRRADANMYEDKKLIKGE